MSYHDIQNYRGTERIVINVCQLKAYRIGLGVHPEGEMSRENCISRINCQVVGEL